MLIVLPEPKCKLFAIAKQPRGRGYEFRECFQDTDILQIHLVHGSQKRAEGSGFRFLYIFFSKPLFSLDIHVCKLACGQFSLQANRMIVSRNIC